MNNQGQVVGASPAGNGSLRAFVYENGSLTDIGDLPGGLDFSIPTDINDMGRVVGNGQNQVGGEAFYWADGVLIGLGNLTGQDMGSGSQAQGINNLDQVVGSSPAADGQNHGIIWNPVTGMQDLNDLIDPLDPLYDKVLIGRAEKINDNGYIVGTGLMDGVEFGYLLTPIPEPSSVAVVLATAGPLLLRRLRPIF